MAEPPRRESLPGGVLTTLRRLLAVLAIASLWLGYVGLRAYVQNVNLQLKSQGSNIAAPRAGAGDLIYYDLELFLLQSTPLAQPAPMDWQLQVARFTAPTVAFFTIAELGLAIFAGRIRRTRLRRARGHTVVCGSTRAADVLAARLRATGTRVVTIDPGTGHHRAWDVVVGSPSSPRTLLDAAAHRASRVYACLEHGQENAEIANAVERIRGGRGRPDRIYALIPDLDLCAALQARRWSLSATGARHIAYFNPDELAARALVRADHAAFAQGTPEIAIVGTGPFARSVLVECARQWLARRGGSREPLRSILIGPQATEVAAGLRDRYAFLGGSCRIEPRTEPLDLLLAQRQRVSAPRLNRLYLCQDDEGEALKAALSSAAHLRSSLDIVVVRLDRMAGVAEGFQRDLSGRALLDALGGRLRMVDVTAEGCDPARIGDDLAEELARACHQRYLTEFGGIGRGAAMVGWEELPEDYRAANRDQAADVGRKLAAIGCLLNPRSAGEPEFAFRSDEVELLAQLEHERWTAERIRSGWTYGSQRDDAAKRHPCVAPWDALTDQYREKDRQAVLAIPAMLADVGLVIVRVEPPGTAVRLPDDEPPFGPETDDFRAAAIDRATNAGIMPAVRLRARPH